MVDLAQVAAITPGKALVGALGVVDKWLTDPRGRDDRSMLDLPDPEWYLDNVLVFAEPGGPTRLLRGAAASWQRWWERQITDDEPMRTAAGQGFVVSTDQLRSLGISR